MMVTSRLSSTAALLLFVALFGCGDAGDQQIVVTESRTLSELFGTGRQLVLEENDSVLLARIADIALASDGRIIVADMLEGNVKAYDSTGALLSIVGRKGDGPGELRQPYGISLGPHGQIAVADAGSSTSYSRFTASGEFVTRVPLIGYYGGDSFHWISDDSMIVGAIPNSGDTTEVVLHVDMSGRIVGRHLPIGLIPPSGMSAHPLWSSIQDVNLVVWRDTVFTTSALHNVLWTLDLATGQTSAREIHFQGYTPPTAPPENVQSPKDLGDWAGSFHLAQQPIIAMGRLVVPFSIGRGGDRVVTHVVRDPDLGWLIVRGPERIVAGNDSTLLTFRGEPGGLEVVIYESEAARQ